MNKDLKNFSDLEGNDDDFDLRLFLQFFLRNKFVVLLISFLALVAAHFY